jgi:succinate dehydrogenase / fumarate reductase cytochrome b subunit
MAEAKVRIERPLSPHLQIYRWSWTMTMSIVHRATGVAIYAGALLLAIWLLALASGPDAYHSVARFFGSVIGRAILLGYTWALMHHLLGGVRHLVWDFGYGMEPGTRMNMARATPIAAAILTVLIWAVAFLTR